MQEAVDVSLTECRCFKSNVINVTVAAMQVWRVKIRFRPGIDLQLDIDLNRKVFLTV